MVDLAEQGVDLALRTGSAEGLPGLISQRLLSSPWGAYASPGYLARRAAPSCPGDLAAHRLLGFRSGGGSRPGAWRFRDLAAGDIGSQLRLDIESPIVFDDGCAAYDMAVAGHGIVWAPEWLATEDLRFGRMVELLAAWRTEEQVISMVRRARRLTPRRVRVVMGLLRQAGDQWQARDARPAP